MGDGRIAVGTLWSCPTCRQVFDDQSMMKLHATYAHFQGQVCSCPNHDEEVMRLRHDLAEMTEERDHWRALAHGYKPLDFDGPVEGEANIAENDGGQDA